MNEYLVTIFKKNTRNTRHWDLGAK